MEESGTSQLILATNGSNISKLNIATKNDSRWHNITSQKEPNGKKQPLLENRSLVSQDEGKENIIPAIDDTKTCTAGVLLQHNDNELKKVVLETHDESFADFSNARNEFYNNCFKEDANEEVEEPRCVTIDDDSPLDILGEADETTCVGDGNNLSIYEECSEELSE